MKPITLCGNEIEFNNITAGGTYTYSCFKQGNIRADTRLQCKSKRVFHIQFIEV